MFKRLILILIFCCSTALARPDKVVGLYLSWWAMLTPTRIDRIIQQSAGTAVNAMVCDFRSNNSVYQSNFNKLKKKGFYLIARIVVFEEGIGANYAIASDPKHQQTIIDLAKKAEKMGFDEIQYDYVRFADRGSADPKKQEIINGFLRKAKDQLSIPLGVDVFGSVAYQPHLIIGQNLSTMTEIVDVASPMLYPSHFYLDKVRMGNPYKTMLEGCAQAKLKIGNKPTRLIPFIQGFAMHMQYSGLSLKEYIKAQLHAVEEAGTDGFYVWNAEAKYDQFFLALKEHGPLYKEAATPLQANLSVFHNLPTQTETVSAPAAETAAPEKPFSLLSLLTFGML